MELLPRSWHPIFCITLGPLGAISTSAGKRDEGDSGTRDPNSGMNGGVSALKQTDQAKLSLAKHVNQDLIFRLEIGSVKDVKRIHCDVCSILFGESASTSAFEIWLHISRGKETGL